jgi:acyl carrier protein
MTEQSSILNIIAEALSFSADKLDVNDDLMGAIPEFDSMAVVNILTSLENHYGFIVDDDEIDAEIFSSVTSLTEFVEQKLIHSE